MRSVATKTVFALASVTSLTGALAASACSSTTIDNPSDSGVEAAVPQPDAAASPACDGTLFVDLTTLPWKPPNVAPGSCSEKELADLVTYIDGNTTAQYPDWKKYVTNAACNACVFGKLTDAKWRPLVEDAMGELAELNVGGCIAIASGKDACGKAYQTWFDCRFAACDDCGVGNSSALKTCLLAATKHACKTAFDTVVSTCGNAVVSDAETRCDGKKFVFEGPIRAQCIGFVGQSDGG